MLMNLEKQKSLFKDEAAFVEFVRSWREAVKQSQMQVVMVNDEVLCTAVSPESTKQLLSERILRRFAENPELLNELKDRFESDEIVDADLPPTPPLRG